MSIAPPTPLAVRRSLGGVGAGDRLRREERSDEHIRRFQLRRFVQLNAWASNGGSMPEDLTLEEQAVWRDAVGFYRLADENGWTVDIPHESV